MPVHVEEMTSEVTITDPDFPLTPAQVDKLVALVMRRMSEKTKQAEQMEDSTKIRRQISDRFEL